MTRLGPTTRLLLALSVFFSLCASTAQSAAANNGLPFYYDRLITAADLRGRTLRELEIRRATIHGRAGLVFLESRLRNYFARIPAYRPGSYDAARLSAIDEQNLQTLAAYEASISRAELKQSWERLLQEHRYAGEMVLQGRLDFSADAGVIAAGPSVAGPRWPVSLFSTATGERISMISWARGYLHALRLVGRDLVVLTDYEALIGGWSSVHPRTRLLIGAKARADGYRDAPPAWACISPDGNIVAVESGGDLTSFDLTQRRRGRTLPLLRGHVAPDECTFTGPRTAFVRRDQFGDSYILDLESQTLTPLAVPPGNCVISPDGALLARWDETLAGHSSDVELWTLQGTARRLRVFSDSAGTRSAALSREGAHLLTADATGRLSHFDTATGVRTLWRGRTEYQRFDTSEDISDNLEALLTRDFSEDRPFPTREVVLDLVTALHFSPDSSHVVVTYLRGNLELRDARSGQPLEAFRGHRPWTDDDHWEVTLLAHRLGLPIDPLWPRYPEFVDPLKHLSALDGRLPEGVIRNASRARLRILRNAIFARRGAPLESQLLRELLAGTRRDNPSKPYTADQLTPIDRDNIMRIKRRERALGGSLSDAALTAAFRRDAGPESG